MIYCLILTKPHVAKKKNYYSYFNYWETSSETLSNLLNLDHTEGEARPGFEPKF